MKSGITMTELVDTHGRTHDYLRMALTERCNLRCFYCMPVDGVNAKDKIEYMSREEIFQIAQIFVSKGIKKIRLTGGEPLARKDVGDILKDLSKLPVELAITTNGILVDRYITLFKELGITKINISLDTLDKDKNLLITKRNYFDKVVANINLLCQENISPKINVVVMKGVNSDQIIPFVELSARQDIDVRFIEFMPFNGNLWELNKCMSYAQIIQAISDHYGKTNLIKLKDKDGFTSRSYKIKNSNGRFGVISSVSEPFCEGCNRIRLTADGKIKNCLFSSEESDILKAFRNNEDIVPIIESCVMAKKKTRAGIEQFNSKSKRVLEQNRSMVQIGG
jgi:GTP 3',8-cyclase